MAEVEDKLKEISRPEELLCTAQDLSFKDERGQEIVARLLMQLAQLHLDLGNLGEVQACYEQSGDMRGTAWTLLDMGTLWQEQGKDHEALRICVSAWPLLRQLQSPLTPVALTGMRMIRAKLGDEQFQAWLREHSAEKTDELLRALDAAP